MVCIPDIVATVTITAPSSAGPIIGNLFPGDVPFVIVTGSEITEPGGGGGGGIGGTGSQNPNSSTRAAKVATCCARCFRAGRLDNVIRDFGKATGHSTIGEFVAGLTVSGTIAAIGNEALNLTSLGMKPRGGLGAPGFSRAGDPTTWQHTVAGSAARSNKIPMLGRIGRVAGRASEVLSLGLLAFEAGYTQGQIQACITACTANPSSF